MVRSGSIAHAAGAIDGHAERRAQRRRRDARGPQIVSRHDISPPTSTRPAATLVTDRFSPDLDAEALEIAGRLRAAIPETRAAARARFEQHDPRRPRIEVTEIARQRQPRNLRERARHLDAGRPAADDDERQQRVRAGRIALPLRPLERQQHAAADVQRVLERFQSGRDRRHSSWPKYACVAPPATIR